MFIRRNLKPGTVHFFTKESEMIPEPLSYLKVLNNSLEFAFWVYDNWKYQPQAWHTLVGLKDKDESVVVIWRPSLHQDGIHIGVLITTAGKNIFHPMQKIKPGKNYGMIKISGGYASVNISNHLCIQDNLKRKFQKNILVTPRLNKPATLHLTQTVLFEPTAEFIYQNTVKKLQAIFL